MREASRPRMRELDRASRFPHPPDEICEIVGRQRFSADQQRRPVINEADAYEVAHDIVGQLRIQRRSDRQPDLMHEQCVAVRRRRRDLAGADRSAGAADILDDDLLAECAAHAFGNEPGISIGGTARRVGDHNRDIAAGVGIGGSTMDRGAQQRERKAAGKHQPFHPTLP